MKYTGLEVIKILSAVEKVNFRSNETFSKFADFDSILPGSPVSEGMHGMLHQMIGDMRRMVKAKKDKRACDKAPKQLT